MYEKAQLAFENYMKNYDLTNPLISLKYKHTYKVVELMSELSFRLNLNKEDMILDGLLDYMENTLPARKPVPDEQALKEQTREELIDKVTEGIRQTAASETKFSHMLTPEEEHIMREVIREYLI